MNIRDILGVPHFNDNKPRVRQAEHRSHKNGGSSDYRVRGVRGEGDAKHSVGKVHKESGLRY